MKPDLSDEDHRLFEKAIQDSLSPDEAEKLQRELAEDDERRKAFVCYAYQHAGLHWHFHGSDMRSLLPLDAPVAGDLPAAEDDRLHRRPSSLAWRAAAAVLILAAGIWFGSTRLQSNRGPSELALTEHPVSVPYVASLVKASNCTWAGGTLPTAAGSELVPGTLHLAEGVATIAFRSGVELTLEGPAHIELIDAMNCRLHEGTAVAHVPDGAEGFSVETETVELVDLGTEFGIHAARNGETTVQVFDGEVDVTQKSTGQVKRLLSGNQSNVTVQDFDLAASGLSELIWEQGGDQSDLNFGDGRPVTVITTRDGAGDDTYIQSNRPEVHGSDTLLLVKNASTPTSKGGMSRKSFLGFDLTSLAGDELERARLELEVAKSGFGYATFVEDSRFKVYGIVSEDGHDWSREDTVWRNAPAHDFETGAGMQEGETVLVGEFAIPQGVFSGIIALESEALRGYLQSRAGGRASLVVVRETVERRGGGLVHAFASRRHPSLSAPTLRLISR